MVVDMLLTHPLERDFRRDFVVLSSTFYNSLVEGSDRFVRRHSSGL